QGLLVVSQAALLSTGVRPGDATAAGLPAAPEFLYEREADAKTICDFALRLLGSFESLDDPFTKILRIGFHSTNYNLELPYMQLQTALMQQRRPAEQGR